MRSSLKLPLYLREQQQETCLVPNLTERSVSQVGAVLPFMDSSSIYDKGLHSLLIKTAEENNIPWQHKEYVSGGTDAGTIQRTGGGIKVGAISAAVRYIHSPSCVASVEDFESIYRLAYEFLKNCGGLQNV